MRLLFVNFSIPIYLGNPGRMGLSIPFIISYIKSKSDHEIKVFDFYERYNHYKGNSKKVEEEYLKVISTYRPDFVGFTTYLENLRYFNEIVKKTKRECPGLKIVVGGVLGTMLPKKTLELFSLVDYAILGEGEIPFYKLISGVDKKQIPSLAYRDKKGVHINKSKELVRLDGISFPERKNFNMTFYTKKQGRSLLDKRFITILSSRGCYARCSFCLQPLIAPDFRSRPNKQVVDEMEYLVKKYGIYNFYFIDSQFHMGKARIKELHTLIMSRKSLSGKISFIVQTRGTLKDIESLRLLKEMGCKKISLGIETGSSKMLKVMNKGIGLEEYYTSCSLIKQAGIDLELLFILGYPGEKSEDIISTIDFVNQVKPDHFIVQKVYPLAGTPLFISLVKKGHLKDYSKAKTIAQLENIIDYNKKQEFYNKVDRDYLKYRRIFEDMAKRTQFIYIFRRKGTISKLLFLFKKENIEKFLKYLRYDPRYILNLIKEIFR